MAGATLPRCSLKVRAQCANRARWESVRGVASNGHPYREIRFHTPTFETFLTGESRMV
jgi:hypothetical protein